MNDLPSAPGVYLFRKKDEVLYVGKSVNIRARVASHIENAKLIAKERSIVEESDHVDYRLTDSEFNALLLETDLIQKYQPKYNSILKDDKSQLYIEISIYDKYPKILLNRKKNLVKNNIYFGPFQSVRIAEMLVKEIRRIVPFCIQPKLTKRPCFYSKIKLCDPCPNSIEYGELSMENKNNLIKIYKKNIKTVIKILKGKADKVLLSLYKELKTLIKNQQYEDAILVRNKINKLESLMFNQSFHEGSIELNYDQSLESINELKSLLREFSINIGNIKRIECFDMSNLAQKQATASMVVFIDGRMNKDEYKRFKIKNTRLRSDTDMIHEIITRRFKNDWEYPSLLVIDGGKPQVSTVLKITKKLNLTIPVIGIAKHPDRFIIGVTKLPTVRLQNNSLALNLIRQIRDESHRFARKYHLLLRDKDLLYN